MEIKVGEYVRTPLGIAKYLGECDDMPGFYKFDKLDENLWFDDIADIIYKNQLDEVILKHSPNIIDLIEEGDYVNGEKVYSKGIATGDYKIINLENGKFIFEEDVKTIVTKEQFEEMEYRV